MRHLTTLAILLSLAAAAAAQDVIKYKDGSADKEGEVTSLNYKTVEYDIIAGNRIKQQEDAKKVAEIVVDRNQTTFDYNRGASAMEGSDYDGAVEHFGRVTKDVRARDLLKQTAAINVVRSQWMKDNIPGCQQAIKELRTLKPDSFFLKESYEYEIRCSLARGDVAGATAAVAGLEEKGKSDNLPEWAKSADVMRGGLQELQNKWREALAIHRKYVSDKDVGDEAKLGEIRCLTQLKDWPGLTARCEAILSELKGKKNPNERLYTAAFNGRGEVQLNGGKLKEALLDFMQGVAVLNKSGGSSQENETALARAAYTCTRIALKESDKSKKDTYKNRARELEGDLKRHYGSSKYAAELAKAIAEIK